MSSPTENRVYLDWNATAPLRPEARAAMLSAMDVVGNPSSVHAEGRAAKAIIEKARRQVAALVGCEPGEVVFTSGATEAAALIMAVGGPVDQTVYASKIEHDCIWEHAAHSLFIGVDRAGKFDLTGDFDLAIVPQLLEGDFVAFQTANGETGVVNDVAGSARYTGERSKGVRIFSDMVQALGKWPTCFNETGADFACASAHKLGGPKGVGALLVREGIEINPFMKGGGQEMRRRSGTENLVGIAGFGAAAEAAQRDLESGVWGRVTKLRDDLEHHLEAAALDINIIGRDSPRLPNTSYFAIPGWKGETQVMQMDLAGFAVSAGSACSSGTTKASRVLLAMGYDEETASSAIRVSMGPTTTEAEVMGFADTWIEHYRRRKLRAA
ncbi:MAG TPA: cysteine desulfurase family protein [Thermohalobaculum sp.]|nr:cysteine desulfurase family protein [Thermohalobaculum sp.]